jgi:hypothetical protein
MRYRVTRTYLNRLGRSMVVEEGTAQILEAPSAVEAATLFIADDTCRLVGQVQALPGDEATATCQSHGEMYVIRATRTE